MTNTNKINTLSNRKDGDTMTNIYQNIAKLNLPLDIAYGDYFDGEDDRFMISSFYLGNCLEATTHELRGIFTSDEFDLLMTLVTSYSPLSLLNIPAKQYLKSNIVDTIKYNEFPDLVDNINPNALIKKLDQLTKF